jgi:ATP-dependent Clp protease protease subunit
MQCAAADLTLVFGQAASTSSLLRAAGQRFAAQRADHDPALGGAQGRRRTSRSTPAKSSHQGRLNQMYVTHTGRTIEEIERAMERDKFFSPPEAKEFGLIDDVLEKRPTPTIQAAAS